MPDTTLSPHTRPSLPRLAWALLAGLMSLGPLTIGLGSCRASETAGDTTGPRTTQPTAAPAAKETAMPAPKADKSTTGEKATFAAGCYWCVEAVLQQVPGVLQVKSGFTGGSVADPTYEDVCTGATGHAEAVQITYDPKVVTYGQLLEWFFRLHDPTTLNRQGHDVGTQYRSAIFYHSPEQEAAARAAVQKLQPHFATPIVTDIQPAGPFYVADAHHQDYYRNNKSQGYCQLVIRPKLEKLGLQK